MAHTLTIDHLPWHEVTSPYLRTQFPALQPYALARTYRIRVDDVLDPLELLWVAPTVHPEVPGLREGLALYDWGGQTTQRSFCASLEAALHRYFGPEVTLHPGLGLPSLTDMADRWTPWR